MIPLRPFLLSLFARQTKATALCFYFSTTPTRHAYNSADYWSRRLRRMEIKEEFERQNREERRAAEKPSRNAYKKAPKLRGSRKDEEEVRISKTLSWLLRHGAKSEGLAVRSDGYARVRDLLALPRLRDVNFQTLERIVQHDAKERYHLLFEPGTPTSEHDPGDCWWIRANQGHSMKDVNLDFSEITDAGQVPMAVHGTNFRAWKIIKKEGLSPMKRAHIHLAQHVSHIKGFKATPGLRSSSQVLIYVDLDKALRAGIRFYLSSNGVVLTKGDETGFLRPEFFRRVTDSAGSPLTGWSGVRSIGSDEDVTTSSNSERGKRSRRQSTEKLPTAANETKLDPAIEAAIVSTAKLISDMDIREAP